ncbi:MAG: isoprenyl transferase [Gammaproteobacteria bacterium]|nr:isoprenyl transferase [Gammaproteobacteria bacterium]
MDSKNTLPKHVAIIMDGNGRWAKKRFMPRVMGHRQGKNNVKKLIQHSSQKGVQVLTIYAFSSENWRRPSEEVSFLMKLFLESLKEELAEMHETGLKVNFLGDLSLLSEPLEALMRETEVLTHPNKGMILNVAVNYGSRSEMLRATKMLCQEARDGKINPDDLTEDLFSQYLYTKGIPDPDLLIRTSGESRISNFLLWQCAYTELYFTDTLFPDFNPNEYDKALNWYASRERRYGMISEQI